MLTLPEYLIHSNFNADQTPFGVNVYTEGIWDSFKHLDLQICINLPSNVLHQIINTVAQKIKNGERFVADVKYDGIVPNFQVVFLYAYNLGEVVLRIILPNSNGEFMGNLQEQKEHTFQLPATYRRLIKLLAQSEHTLEQLTPKYDAEHVSQLMMAGVLDFSDTSDRLMLTNYGKKIVCHLQG